MWILQEAVLPKRGTILLGQYQWDVENFFAIAEYIRDNQLDLRLHDNEGGFLQCLKAAAARRERHELQKRPTFLDGLREARERDAGDARDKVFAILGLCDQDVISHGITPDYEDSVEKVYTTVAKYLLESSERSLSMLLAIDGSGSKLNLPSWIPDWSHRIATPATIREFEKSMEWTAGGQEQPCVEITQTNGTEMLKLRGKIVSSLNSCVDRYSKDLEEAFYQETQTPRTTCEKIGLWYFNLVFCAECFEDSDTNTDLPPRTMDQYFLERCEKLTRASVSKDLGWYEQSVVLGKNNVQRDILWRTLTRESINEQIGEFKKDLLKYIARAYQHDADNPIQSAFLYDLSQWARHRKFGILANRAIGWVPLQARKGDLVCIFQESDLPFVIRPIDGGESFTVVGSCYLHGIMHGELAYSDEWPWREIVLQ